VTFNIDLSGSRALVTGGGQGVGRATCLALSAAGAAVLVNDYVAERAESVAGEVRELGGEADPTPFDVTDYDAVMANASDRGIDILVNNAGNAGVQGFNFGPFAESTPADWERYFGVNLYGVMHCARAVVPGMIERQRGRVITIVSDAGRWGEPGMAAYSAAKAGAAGFTRSLARDLGRHGITVNNIALGTIDTFGLSERAMTPDEAERDRKRMRPYIIRRPGRPEEVAALVTFLAGPQAAWITGQTYPVNGGYTVNQ
jgi:3-oxoacyl-[acyl-carrier protein] reductase